MKQLLAITLIAFTLGCTKEAQQVAACKAEDAAAAFLSKGIATQLSCENVDAILADMKVIVAKTNLCKEPPAPVAAPVSTDGTMVAAGVVSTKSVVGNILCPVVVESAVNAASGQLPAAWKCTGNGKPEALKAYLLEQCTKSL